MGIGASQIPPQDAANNPGDVLPGPMKSPGWSITARILASFASIRNLRRCLQQSKVPTGTPSSPPPGSSEPTFRGQGHCGPHRVGERRQKGCCRGVQRWSLGVIESENAAGADPREPQLACRSSGVTGGYRFEDRAVSATGVCESAGFMMLFLAAGHSRRDGPMPRVARNSVSPSEVMAPTDESQVSPLGGPARISLKGQEHGQLSISN